MPLAQLGALLADVDPAPAPSPTARVLEDWEVTPGLEGFLATFAVAAAAVVLFLSLSRHLRKADANARELGYDVPERKGIAVRRSDAGTDADGTGPAREGDREATASADVGATPESPDVAGEDDRRGLA